MSYLWNYMEKQNWSCEKKVNWFIRGNMILFGVLGLALWSVVQIFAFQTVEWMICFIGYPAFFLGCIGGILWLGRRQCSASR